MFYGEALLDLLKVAHQVLLVHVHHVAQVVVVWLGHQLFALVVLFWIEVEVFVKRELLIVGNLFFITFALLKRAFVALFLLHDWRYVHKFD